MKIAIKKSHIASIAIIGLLTSSLAYADNSNNLVQLDLKRASDNSVDITLFTSDIYGDNVMVRKKSDTKYVILIPKVQSSGYKASSLSGVNDLVSNIDVKTVDDTSGGYTKVTLITTRPLDIKTKAQKSAPATAEQKEYNSLIAQANAIKNNVSKQEPQKNILRKTEVTVNKASDIKKEIKKTETPKTDKKEKNTKISIKSEPPKTVPVNNSNTKQIQKTNPVKLIDEIKQEKELEELPIALPKETTANVEQSQNTVETDSNTSSVINNFAKLPKPLRIGIIIMLILALVRKIFKSIKSQYIVETQYNSQETSKYDSAKEISDATETNIDYVNDSGLSWKEKYQLYLDKSATPVKRANNKGTYSFIKTPSKQAIENKREELEKMVTSEEVKLDSIEPEVVEIHSEDESITKAIKLRAFDEHPGSLVTSERKHSRFKGYEHKIPLKENTTVDLEDSPLSVNPRSLKEANLKVSDVDKRRITYEPKEYIMSSIDEYFSILDKEKTENEIKENISRQLPEPYSQKEHMTLPSIKREKPASIKDIIIKSEYKIAPDKGIYMVSKNGKNALVGKVNNKTFVLKRFDGKMTDTINVRHDNANVYMVKAGKFKSLVEVDDNKMDVLIEL